MKKISLILLTIASIVVLTACGKDEDNENSKTTKGLEVEILEVKKDGTYFGKSDEYERLIIDTKNVKKKAEYQEGDVITIKGDYTTEESYPVKIYPTKIESK